MVRLKVYDGAEKVRELELGSDLITIGREDGSTVVLEDPSVSRRHATVEPTGSFYIVRDAGSTNGTFVNEVLVRSHVLSHGDLLRVGKYVLHYDTQSGKSSESTQVRVEKLALPGSSVPGTSSGAK